MERHVEGLVEVLVRFQVVPAAEPRDEDEVAGGGDRQELRETLDEPEDEGLPVR